MPSTFHRDPLTWLSYLLLALYGFFLNLLGPITPLLKDELGLSYTVSSLHFTAFASGILLVGLGGHHAIRRFGRGCSLWIGAGGLGFGALGLALGRDPAVTITAAFTMGLVGSLILVIIPSSLADQHGELRAVAFTEANVVASLVAASAPLLVGWSMGFFGSWRVALAAAAAAPLVLYLAFGGRRPGEAPVPPDRGSEGTLPGLFWTFWSAIVLAVSAEFCMIAWCTEYLVKQGGMPRTEATQALTLFLTGMILGRLAGSRAARRRSAHGLVTASVLTAGAGFLLFWSAQDVRLVLAGLVITGLGIASLYPMLLALALGAAGDRTDRASARATLASGAAILALPLTLGRLADVVGIQRAYSLVAFLLLGVLAISQFAHRMQRPV